MEFAMIIIIVLVLFFLLFVITISKVKSKKKVSSQRRQQKRYFTGDIQRFEYATLSLEKQSLYDIIVDELSRYSFDINLEGMGFSSSNFSEVQRAILCDHPEFFWIDSISFTYIQGMNEIVAVKINSHYTRYEIEERKNQIDRAVDRILRQIPSGMDDYGKALIIHDIIINETSYGSFGTNCQHIDSVLIDHYSVCAGYSKTYQYLLNLIGIEATTVSGHGHSESHAWNLVCLDGDYYYIDVTWDDPTCLHSGHRHRHEDILSHDYFAITTEELLRNHDFEYDKNAYPRCIATADNYFVRENRYYISVSQFADAMKEAFVNGEQCFEGKLKNHKEINRIVRGSFLNSIGIGSITYSINEDMGTLTVERR